MEQVGQIIHWSARSGIRVELGGIMLRGSDLVIIVVGSTGIVGRPVVFGIGVGKNDAGYRFPSLARNLGDGSLSIIFLYNVIGVVISPVRR